jgi:hypothetical protein
MTGFVLTGAHAPRAVPPEPVGRQIAAEREEFGWLSNMVSAIVSGETPPQPVVRLVPAVPWLALRDRGPTARQQVRAAQEPTLTERSFLEAEWLLAEPLKEPLVAPRSAVRHRTSRLIADLLASEDEDKSQAAAAVIQQELRANSNVPLARALASVASSGAFGADRYARCLALDILAGARAPRFQELVLDVIRTFLIAEDERLKISGIASATFLPSAAKRSLRPMVEVARRVGGARLQRAAAAFLRESPL